MHYDRISKLHNFKKQHNWDCLKFPLEIDKIGKFEQNNPHIAINAPFIENKHSLHVCQNSVSRIVNKQIY